MLSKCLPAQIVFCPPGATWNYSFIKYFGSTEIENEKIIYEKDTLVNGETVKLLRHERAFMACNLNRIKFTLLKQKGDTIFINNQKTQNTWQILYNFAAQAGQSWQTTFIQDNSTVVTYTMSVDSVKNVIINGMTLKQLYAGYSITERLGCNPFLFYFNNNGSGSCHHDYVSWFLCYQDSVFGTYQLTEKPCDFTNPLGINNISDFDKVFAVYPSPTVDWLRIEFNSINVSDLYLFDNLGNELIHRPVQANEHEKDVDIGDLDSGIYQLVLRSAYGWVSSKKIVKE